VRLDKFLKVARIVKRRTLAQELCLGGHVAKNGRTAKPATEVSHGDVIDVDFGSRKARFKVVSLEESRGKKEAASMYEVLSGDEKESKS